MRDRKRKTFTPKVARQLCGLLLCIAIIAAIVIIAPKLTSTYVEAYKVSAVDTKVSKVPLYSDTMKSDNNPQIDSILNVNDEFRLKIKDEYEVDVYAYFIDEKKWNKVELIELGNNQFSFIPLSTTTQNGLKRTILYRVEVKQKEGAGITKYFTVKGIE